MGKAQQWESKETWEFSIKLQKHHVGGCQMNPSEMQLCTPFSRTESKEWLFSTHGIQSVSSILAPKTLHSWALPISSLLHS